MSNLNNNTTQLEALLTKVNALPEAGVAEDLDTELTAQENLISQLSTILDSKASGGSENGACTVNIVFENGLADLTWYQYANNEDEVVLNTVATDDFTSYPHTISLNDVKCNSLFVTGLHNGGSGFYLITVEIDGVITNLSGGLNYRYGFITPKKANSVATVRVVLD